MPITRSRKNSPRREPSEELQSNIRERGSSVTEETELTGTVVTTADVHPGRRDPAARTLNDNVQTARAKIERRRKELEARRQLAQQQLEGARAAAVLIATELDVLRLDEEELILLDNMSSEDKEDEVRSWVQTTVDRLTGKGQQEEAHIRLQPEEVSGKGHQQEEITHETSTPRAEEPPCAAKEPETQENTLPSWNNFAEAIVQAINRGSAEKRETCHHAQPSYVHELPVFDGNCEEWIPFKNVYEDTAQLFSPVQNMARLRKALKGTARASVRTILHSNSQPEKVIASLKTRYGKPDTLIRAEIEKVKNFPKIAGSTQEISNFASHIDDLVETVRALKRPEYLFGPELTDAAISKLPREILSAWTNYAATNEDKGSTLERLSSFLNEESLRRETYGPREVVQRRQPHPRQAAHTLSDNKEAELCPHCQGDHHLYDCRKFKESKHPERWEIATKSRLCFKCLHGRHRKETCRRPPCRYCKRWHHTLLHENKEQEPKREAPKEIANNVKLPVNTLSTQRAYLKMVPVEVYGPEGRMKILALLDEGSTVTLLDASVADKVGLIGPKETLSLETVGGKVISNENSMKLNMKIRGVHQKQKRSITGARSISNLHLTPQLVKKDRIHECTHLKKMADQLIYDEEPPRLLIGQDNWDLIISKSTRKGRKGQPVASLTKLGWVLHGADSGASKEANFCAHLKSSEEHFEELIKEHFAIESLGIQPRRPTVDLEEKAFKRLTETTHRRPDGRFGVGLIWKNDEEEMPENYKGAENRLRSIEKKLDKNPDMKQEYSNQVQHLLDSGYAEEVGYESSSPRTWYLPHFAVTHPTKKKMRLVFDAAAKFGGKSLNDALMPGPDLLQSLFGVLLRFRQKRVAVVSDIKEMFLQIRIQEKDRDSLRFLWRGDRRTGAPKIYRMTSVVFGAACSPSIAIFIKNKNAEEHKEQHPEAARAIERNHYMDDYLQSFDTQEEAVKTAKEVYEIHRKAGFELRGWASNDTEVLRRITDEEIINEIELGSKEEKTLGLLWFTQTDDIGFRACLRNIHEDVSSLKKTPTKREVTSAVMSTFDPLGLASPVLIQGKKLIQDIWRSGVGWDEQIHAEGERKWKSYLDSLQLLRSLRIPRCVSHFADEGELHVFTDASEEAYACAVYWRNSTIDGQHHVALLAGKARVTPLKPISIPRLELQAALLGSRMARSIQQELDLKICRKTYWTDSSTVLSWIKTDPRTFKPFVAHRLAEIEDSTKPQEWRWVPTAQNPADDATRDTPGQFDWTHRWFTGPSFLREDESLWPEPRCFKKQQLTGEEKEKSTTTAIHTLREHPTPDPTRYSSWYRLQRTTARVLQFIDLCRKRNVVNAIKKSDPLWKKNHKRARVKPNIPRQDLKERRYIPIDPVFLKKAEIILLKRSQEESFKEELTQIRRENPLSRSSRLKKVDIEMHDGLLRLRGRINAAAGPSTSFKTPVILDGKNQITKLLIEHVHRSFNHGNHATVINELRQRYWILGLRSVLRTIAHRCQWCILRRGNTLRSPTGDLPKERLQYGEPPFTCAAVDYFGPFTITIGRRHEKRWGALFTCLTTRAVHIELAASLSADSMILALRRMAARRGMPKTIFSDNGTNFVKASKELNTEVCTETMVTAAGNVGVRWKFIPPGAPNMGGAWERLVRSIKTALTATLHEQHPHEEVLHTLLLEAEHIVNSRPLVEDFEGTQDGALTPNHFLIGRSCGSPSVRGFDDSELHGRRTWKMAQRLTDHFWSRWVKEYLPTLIPRRNQENPSRRDLQPGDTVLIVDHTLPRGTWPRGIVTNTYPGPDGRTRIVDVRTAAGVLKRPTSKTILLVPVDQPSQDTGDAGPEDGAAHEGETVGASRTASEGKDDSSCPRARGKDSVS